MANLLAVGEIGLSDERFARSGNLGDRGGPGRWNHHGIAWRGSSDSKYLINNGQKNGYWFYDDYLINTNGKSGEVSLSIDAPLWVGTDYRGFNQAGANAKENLDRSFGDGTYDKHYPLYDRSGNSQLDIYKLHDDGTVSHVGPGQVGVGGGSVNLDSSSDYVLRVSARNDGYIGDYKIYEKTT